MQADKKVFIQKKFFKVLFYQSQYCLLEAYLFVFHKEGFDLGFTNFILMMKRRILSNKQSTYLRQVELFSPSCRP